MTLLRSGFCRVYRVYKMSFQGALPFPCGRSEFPWRRRRIASSAGRIRRSRLSSSMSWSMEKLRKVCSTRKSKSRIRNMDSLSATRNIPPSSATSERRFQSEQGLPESAERGKQTRIRTTNTSQLLTRLFLLFSSLTTDVFGDLPVHCDFGEIPGVWKMKVGRLQPKSGFDGSNFDRLCGQTIPGDEDGWQDLAPGTGTEWNLQDNKYFLTARMQYVAELTLLLKEGNHYEEAEIRILDRVDYEDNPHKLYGEKSPEEYSTEFQYIPVTKKKSKKKKKDSDDGDDESSDDDDKKEFLKLNPKYDTTLTPFQRSEYESWDALEGQHLPEELRRGATGGYSMVYDMGAYMKFGSMESKSDLEYFNRNRHHQKQAHQGLCADGSTTDHQGKCDDHSSPVHYGFHDHPAKDHPPKDSFFQMNPQTPAMSMLDIFRKEPDDRVSKGEGKSSKSWWNSWNSWGSKVEKSVESTFGNMKENFRKNVGMDKTMRWNEEHMSEAVVTEMNFWAPAKFLVPPGGDKHESNFAVMHKNTDCRKTLVGSFKEILMSINPSRMNTKKDAAAFERHNRVTNELCYYMEQIVPWKRYVEAHPEELDVGALQNTLKRNEEDHFISSIQSLADVNGGNKCIVCSLGGTVGSDAEAIKAEKMLTQLQNKVNEGLNKGIDMVNKVREDMAKDSEALKKQYHINLRMQQQTMQEAKQLLIEGTVKNVGKHYMVLQPPDNTCPKDTEYRILASMARGEFYEFLLSIFCPLFFWWLLLSCVGIGMRYGYRVEPFEYSQTVRKLSRSPEFWRRIGRVGGILAAFWMFVVMRNLVVKTDNKSSGSSNWLVAGTIRVGKNYGGIVEHELTKLGKQISDKAKKHIKAAQKKSGEDDDAKDASRNRDAVVIGDSDKEQASLYDRKDTDTWIKKKYLSGFHDLHDKMEYRRIQKKQELVQVAAAQGKHIYDLKISDLFEVYPEPNACGITGDFGDGWEPYNHEMNPKADQDGNDRFFYVKEGRDPMLYENREYLDRDSWKHMHHFDWRRVFKRVKKGSSDLDMRSLEDEREHDGAEGEDGASDSMAGMSEENMGKDGGGDSSDDSKSDKKKKKSKSSSENEEEEGSQESFVEKKLEKKHQYYLVSNFVPDTIDQGDCGSCFAAGTTGMSTARYWVKYPHHKHEFKIKSPLPHTHYEVQKSRKNASPEEKQEMKERAEKKYKELYSAYVREYFFQNDEIRNVDKKMTDIAEQEAYDAPDDEWDDDVRNGVESKEENGDDGEVDDVEGEDPGVSFIEDPSHNHQKRKSHGGHGKGHGGHAGGHGHGHPGGHGHNPHFPPHHGSAHGAHGHHDGHHDGGHPGAHSKKRKSKAHEHHEDHEHHEEHEEKEHEAKKRKLKENEGEEEDHDHHDDEEDHHSKHKKKKRKSFHVFSRRGKSKNYNPHDHEEPLDEEDWVSSWYERMSIDQQLEANSLNQGCGGGDPYLAAWFLQMYPAVGDRCWRKLREIDDPDERMRVQTTDKLCHNQFQVTRKTYTSGSIGGCGISSICEELIQRELYYNGPISVAVDMSFSKWDSGVHVLQDREVLSLHHEDDDHEKADHPKKITPKMMREAQSAFDKDGGHNAVLAGEHFAWQRVEHAVLLVGWGETDELGCRARLRVQPDEQKLCDDNESNQAPNSDINNLVPNPSTPASAPHLSKTGYNRPDSDFALHRESAEFRTKFRKNKKMCEKHSFCRYSGMTYWVIQNSWGEGWGSGGFGKYGPRGHDALLIEYGSFVTEVKKVSQDITFVGENEEL